MARTDSTQAVDGFAAAWDIASSGYLPAFILVSALFALTGAGERPVGCRPACRHGRAAGGRDPRSGRLAGDLARLDDDDVMRLNLGTSSPLPRFRVRIDDRTIGASGCAPDLFWIAVWSKKAVHVDTSCRATGTPIRVELGPVGVGVAVVEPDAPRWSPWCIRGVSPS